jgi:hypothetical protein
MRNAFVTLLLRSAALDQFISPNPIVNLRRAKYVSPACRQPGLVKSDTDCLISFFSNFGYYSSRISDFILLEVFSDSASIAFRLVELIAYGPDAGDDSDEGVHGDFIYKSLVHDYAQDFSFSNSPTSQMIAAFPIFLELSISGYRPSFSQAVPNPEI